MRQIDDRTPMPAEPAAERRIGQPEASTRQGLDDQGQLMAVASIGFDSMAIPGSRRSDSYALITDWATHQPAADISSSHQPLPED